MLIEEISRRKMHHTQNGRFFNPWHPNSRRNFFDLLKWKLFSSNIYRDQKKRQIPFNVITPDISKLDQTSSDYMIWLGQSTILMKINAKVILTDPVFWNINFFLKRTIRLPIDPEKLPAIDYVLVSHGHYDHLDTRSIRFLRERSDPYFVSGPGYENYFRSIGTSKHIVLDWWDTYAKDDIILTALPVQHWSKRGLFDTDQMLWCSFLIEHGMKKYYWVGDSGYFEGYKEIGEKFGPIDVLLIPIGSYEPRWFMKTFHVTPEEAMLVAKEVRARYFVPIHWGTFDLTDEPLWLPILHLKEIYQGHTNPALKILEHGGHLIPD
jgi:L-ascorbate metabolism protein UlaG (beta-lactamase superfamily)